MGANKASLIVLVEWIVTEAKTELDLSDQGLRPDAVAEGLICDDAMSRIVALRGWRGNSLGTRLRARLERTLVASSRQRLAVRVGVQTDICDLLAWVPTPVSLKVLQE